MAIIEIKKYDVAYYAGGKNVAATQKGSGYISCHYLAEDYPQVLDILRNEKPAYVEFEVRPGNIASIRTSAEPVGEGELDHERSNQSDR